MDHRTTVFAIIVILMAFAVIAYHVANCLWKWKIESAEKSWPPTQMWGLLALVLFFGMAIGSSAIAYPTLATWWSKIGLNLSEIRPIDAPVAGTDYVFDAATKTLTRKDTNPKMVLTLKEKQADKGTFVVTKKVLTADDFSEMTVYFQDKDDTRTSSEVPLVH